MGHAAKLMRKNLLFLSLFCLMVWGGVRLYYQLTDGFCERNIASSYPIHPGWETRQATEEEWDHLAKALAQSYSYLAKGCQSYVFVSEDDQYVIKFFKFQRYRINPLLHFFSKWRVEKELKKQEKRERFFQSWKLAYNCLAKECGLVYVHLNRTNYLQKSILFYDKLGLTHQLKLDEYVFLVQRKAKPLVEQLPRWSEEEIASFCHRLIDQSLSEYRRGLFDADPALLQNTGVLEGEPIHLDVGQWVAGEDSKTEDQYKQELYDKLFSLHAWLVPAHSSLAKQVENAFFLATQTPWQAMQPGELGCY